MGAVAEAASLGVVAALEGVKFAVGGTEAGGRGQGGEVRAGRLLHRRGQRAFPQRGREHAGARFEVRQMIRRVLDSIPSASEASGVEIADDGLAFAGRRGPSDPVGRAVGEIPSKEKLEARGLPWSNGCGEAEHTDGIMRFGFRPQIAGSGELIPEMEWSIPPAACGPAGPVGGLHAVVYARGEDELARHGIVGGERGIAHPQADDSLPSLIIVSAPVGSFLPRGVAVVLRGVDGVLNGERNRHLSGYGARVGDAIAENGDR